MEGAVTLGAVSGSGAPPGWKLIRPSGNEAPQTIVSWTLSDGTFILILSEDMLEDEEVKVVYDGSNSAFKVISNNDTVRAFSHDVTNYSTYLPDIPSGVAGRNLGILLLGHNPTNPTEMQFILAKIHITVTQGHINNLNLDDYFLGCISTNYPFRVQNNVAPYWGIINVTENRQLSNGYYMEWRIVGKNSYRNTVNDFDHVVIASRNCLGYGEITGASGFWMNTTDTHDGGYEPSAMRYYVSNQMLMGLQNTGIPFYETWIPAITRTLWDSVTDDVFTVSDKLFLPGSFEVNGAANGCDAREAANGYLSWHGQNATHMIKRNFSDVPCIWWLASAKLSTTSFFCYIDASGATSGSSADLIYGVAPIFCVR
jgi:hypothetical protein